MGKENLKYRKKESNSAEQKKQPLLSNEAKQKLPKDLKPRAKSAYSDLRTQHVNHQKFSKIMTLISVVVVFGVAYYKSFLTTDMTFVSRKEHFEKRSMPTTCDNDYLEDISAYPECKPVQCSRFISDTIVSELEGKTLLEMAEAGFKLSQSDGGASILDLQSGALSKGNAFMNVYSLPDADEIFPDEKMKIYQGVTKKIRNTIAEHFKIDAEKLYLTHPSFFSQITNRTAKTEHDKYWLPHIDKETYQTFHYTSLVYLSDYKKDFEGGRFVYIDKRENKADKRVFVEPKMGRLSAFTSGADNLHHIEQVTSGVRYAITISFTCDKRFALKFRDSTQNTKEK